jgi:hypothetical protein
VSFYERVCTISQNDGRIVCLARTELTKGLLELAQCAPNLSTGEVRFGLTGMMKTGKSTLAKAITGADVSPSRGTPMTTVPTLLKHDALQKKPVLELPVDLLNKLVDAIKSSMTMIVNATGE